MTKTLMWQTWTQASRYGKLPSEVVKIKPKEEVTAWMFNTAITWFGITIENALSERVKVGYGQKEQYKPKYTLARLLSPGFLLMPPAPELEESRNPFAELASWIGRSKGLIKKWVYVPPVEEDKKVDDG